MNTPKHALPWLTKQNELSDSRLNEILEPIFAFSLRQKNEVFSAQLEQIEKQQSHIAKAFELAEAYVPSNEIDVQQVNTAVTSRYSEPDPLLEL